MKRPSIVSLGEVLWDLFPNGERFGGAAANFACHAAIQGADVTMVSSVGDDQRGHDAVSILKDYKIDVGLVQVNRDSPTGTVGIELDVDGKPTFRIHEGSAWDQLTWNENLSSRVSAADAVYFGTLGQRDERSRETILRAVEVAKSAGICRVLDINLRPPFYDAQRIRASIRLASILKISDDELAEVCSSCGIAEDRLPEAMMRGLLDFGDLDMVVMTRGANGAVLVTREGTVCQNGIKAAVIDTVGAGDSFAAAFLIGVLLGKAYSETLHDACVIAAAACAHSGAVPELITDANEGNMRRAKRGIEE